MNESPALNTTSKAFSSRHFLCNSQYIFFRWLLSLGRVKYIKKSCLIFCLRINEKQLLARVFLPTRKLETEGEGREKTTQRQLRSRNILHLVDFNFASVLLFHPPRRAFPRRVNYVTCPGVTFVAQVYPG